MYFPLIYLKHGGKFCTADGEWRKSARRKGGGNTDLKINIPTQERKLKT